MGIKIIETWAHWVADKNARKWCVPGNVCEEEIAVEEETCLRSVRSAPGRAMSSSEFLFPLPCEIIQQGDLPLSCVTAKGNSRMFHLFKIGWLTQNKNQNQKNQPNVSLHQQYLSCF